MAHAKQELKVDAPTEVENVLGRHRVQVLACAPAKDPAWHCTQEMLPPLENCPAEQGVGAADAEAQENPGGQGVQAADPSRL